MSLLNGEDRVLVVAPHPDDEALAAGGLLAGAAKEGAAIKLVFLTNGEGNTLGHMRWKKRLLITAQQERQYGLERREEARRAAALLGGAGTEFWGYCDLGLFELLAESDEELPSRLAALIKDWRPTVVIYPSALDLHRDHSAASLLTEFALNRLGDAAAGIRRLRYINHGAGRCAEAAWDSREELPGARALGKLELLKTYDSQFSLHGRAWRRLSRRAERFFSSGAQTAPEFRHEFSGAGSFWVFSSFRPSRLNTPALYILGADGSGVKRCFYGRLRRARLMRLREFGGRAPNAAAQVQVLYGASGCYLRLPRALFEGCDRVYIKARRKLSFFDDSGFSGIGLREPARGEPRTAVVMPCYNIAAQAEEAARRALPHADAVIAVDDGSGDDTSRRLGQLGVSEGAAHLEVLRLERNSGKGAALAAGFARALQAQPPFDLILTMDGDLQHHPEDIPRFKLAWRDGADFISGRRAFRMDAPLRSRLGNRFINWLTARLYPNAVADTQSGFRGFGRELLRELLKDEGRERGRGGYEAELSVLIAVMRKNARFIELDIPAIYLDRNRTSHFKPVADSLRIVLTLLKHRFLAGRTR